MAINHSTFDACMHCTRKKKHCRHSTIATLFENWTFYEQKVHTDFIILTHENRLGAFQDGQYLQACESVEVMSTKNRMDISFAWNIFSFAQIAAKYINKKKRPPQWFLCIDRFHQNKCLFHLTSWNWSRTMSDTYSIVYVRSQNQSQAKAGKQTDNAQHKTNWWNTKTEFRSSYFHWRAFEWTRRWLSLQINS